ncbi:glycosyltransferase family 2 protein [Salinibacterium sp. M195]|uniref:glycosyltransferase family 2 protein n=1 Tax=Salinibacterium sp. M195 TaxID=2583374 RepID=UPI001C63312B|nr:glycosyltransferase family 2 protein [Salinibacterium sp. M195]QYH36950.1 glycosyltransferase family 2 protein [Salinibacterium sp. M195]
MTTMPRVAICVVTYNSAELIADLVSSLAPGAEGVAWTLVFADNASTDDTLAEIETHAPHSTVVRNGGNLGYAAGINAAVAAAGQQDAYLILNADVRLDPGCVLTLYETLAPEIGIVVPRLTDANGALISSLRRTPTVLRAWGDALLGAERAGQFSRLGEIVTDPNNYLSEHATDWAEGSTQLISAECWSSCGQWDESYFLYSEETEYDLRVRDFGLVTWYQPRASAEHLEGGSAGNPRQWSLLIANRIKHFASGHGKASTFGFWCATLVREGTRSLLGRRTSRAAFRDLITPARLREPRGPQWLADVKL